LSLSKDYKLTTIDFFRHILNTPNRVSSFGWFKHALNASPAASNPTYRLLAAFFMVVTPLVLFCVVAMALGPGEIPPAPCVCEVMV